MLRPIGRPAVDLRADQQRGHGVAGTAPAMARKSAATRLAPPTSAPSTCGKARIAAALPGFTDPPYRMRRVPPAAPKRAARLARIAAWMAAISASVGVRPVPI